jgi:RNA polymerase sigma factor (sigma-70 family)
MDDQESDASVITRSSREPEAFAAIFDRYFARIHRYVASRLGSNAADDIAADIFLAAFDQRDRYDEERVSARAWLYGIATNKISRYWRDEERLYRALQRTGVDGDEGAHDDLVAARVSAASLQPQLAKGLAGLPEGTRDVLLLVACAQLPYDEVAAALDIPIGTVSSRLNRARKHLRHTLGQEAATHG